MHEKNKMHWNPYNYAKALKLALFSEFYKLICAEKLNIKIFENFKTGKIGGEAEISDVSSQN